MRRLVCLIGLTASALAQSSIVGAGYVSPMPVSVAPGQLITIFLQGIPDPIPGPSAISAVFHQLSGVPMPVLDVRGIATCGSVALFCVESLLGVTVQVPYGIQTVCPMCANPLAVSGAISVSANGSPSATIAVQPQVDQVHFFTQCDVIVSSSVVSLNDGGLPCPPLVTHADGTMVSATKPAKSGEELVAYATGLGETTPPLTTGKPAPVGAPTQTVFAIDFNYRPNALATKPAAGSAAPLFTGVTAGFVGLYQVNFIVPPAPPNLPACVDISTVAPFTNVVESNLTVSIGSNYSFDGAGICVSVR